MEGCPEALPGTVIDTLYIVADGFNMAMASVEFMVDISEYFLFLADIVSAGVVEGNSVGGIRISYPAPADATGRLVVNGIVFTCMCEVCADVKFDTPLEVLPYPESGKIQAYRWPDMVGIEAVGLTSYLCWTASPVKHTTWGNIKALFFTSTT